ncbi:hypothetical protein BDR06DRAFT_969501 [Suillus hirtellus]|nr:hypothetical protein BDR06DRAFT_969501 [Suillus hirtellus]
MSSRPSISSCATHLDRRRILLPMQSSHPKLRTLRQCTSLEWVYNSSDDTDGIIDDRMVIRVGEDISIYPADTCAVPTRDGSLPVMSYWYGKVVDIYLKTVTKALPSRSIQEVWLNIQWYYHRLDLEDEGIESIVDMGCVEDHATILPYDEGDLEQHQIPVKTLYNHWTIDIQFSKNRQLSLVNGVNIHNGQTAMKCACHWCDPLFSSPMTLQRYCRKCQQWFNKACLALHGRRLKKKVKASLSSIYRDVDFDPEFLSTLTMPIQRGGSYGIIRNSLILILGHALIEEAGNLG